MFGAFYFILYFDYRLFFGELSLGKIDIGMCFLASSKEMSNNEESSPLLLNVEEGDDLAEEMTMIGVSDLVNEEKKVSFGTVTIDIYDPIDIDSDICRICHEDDLEEELFRPCKCDGTIRYVHPGCLDHWRASQWNQDCFEKCPQCHYTYRTNDLEEPEQGRFYKCNIYLTQNTLIFYVLNQAILVALAVLIRLVDPFLWIVSIFNAIGIEYGPKNNGASSDDMNNSGNGEMNDTSNGIFDHYLFYYYLLSVGLYLVFLLICFTINLIRLKNRRLYLSTYARFGGWVWLLAGMILLIVNMFISFILGTFLLTMIVQIMIKTHYQYFDLLRRAAQHEVIPYSNEDGEC